VLVRTLVTILNLVGFAIAIALEFVYPEIALPVFYALLIWYVASIFLYRSSFMARPIGRGAPPAAPPPPPAPLPAAAAAPAPSGPTLSQLDFCAFCGTNVKPGTTQCPVCGKPIPFL
jgi:hypothetical protein